MSITRSLIIKKNFLFTELEIGIIVSMDVHPLEIKEMTTESFRKLSSCNLINIRPSFGKDLYYLTEKGVVVKENLLSSKSGETLILHV